MASYRAYAYCEECDRPLRKHEYLIETTYRGGHRCKERCCVLCNSSGREPVSMLCSMILVLITCLLAVIAVAGIVYFSWPARDTLIMSAFPVAFLSLLIYVRWQNSQFEQIYERWVMQHSTDPYNWPEATKPE